MLALLTLALASFSQIFTLGFQSRCVNAGNYLAAYLCSSLIGISQVYVWKHIMGSTDSLLAVTVYSQSGALAIMAAIWTHKKFFKEKN